MQRKFRRRPIFNPERDSVGEASSKEQCLSQLIDVSAGPNQSSEQLEDQSWKLMMGAFHHHLLFADGRAEMRQDSPLSDFNQGLFDYCSVVSSEAAENLIRSLRLKLEAMSASPDDLYAKLLSNQLDLVENGLKISDKRTRSYLSILDRYSAIPSSSYINMQLEISAIQHSKEDRGVDSPLTDFANALAIFLSQADLSSDNDGKSSQAMIDKARQYFGERYPDEPSVISEIEQQLAAAYARVGNQRIVECIIGQDGLSQKPHLQRLISLSQQEN